MATKAFSYTSNYDSIISDYFRKEFHGNVDQRNLKYGINPHQKPAQIYSNDGSLPLKGKWTSAFCYWLQTGLLQYFKKMAFYSDKWFSKLHKFMWRFERLAISTRIETSPKFTSSYIIQACKSGRSWYRVIINSRRGKIFHAYYLKQIKMKYLNKIRFRLNSAWYQIPTNFHLWQLPMSELEEATRCLHLVISLPYRIFVMFLQLK